MRQCSRARSTSRLATRHRCTVYSRFERTREITDRGRMSVVEACRASRGLRRCTTVVHVRETDETTDERSRRHETRNRGSLFSRGATAIVMASNDDAPCALRQFLSTLTTRLLSRHSAKRSTEREKHTRIGRAGWQTTPADDQRLYSLLFDAPHEVDVRALRSTLLRCDRQ